MLELVSGSGLSSLLSDSCLSCEEDCDPLLDDDTLTQPSSGLELSLASDFLLDLVLLFTGVVTGGGGGAKPGILEPTTVSC